MLILKENGQAALEYILLFMLSVFLSGGLMYQFNDAFRQFVDGYFGQYLTCLIEAGELPSLGGGGGFCEDEFQPFSLANGRAPVGPQGPNLAPLPPYQKPNYPPNEYVPLGPVEYKSTNPYAGANTTYESRGSDGRSGGGGNVGTGGGGAGGGGVAAGGGGSWGGGLLGNKNNGGGGSSVGLSKQEREASSSSLESTGGGIVGRVNRVKKSDDRPLFVPMLRSESDDSDGGRVRRLAASQEEAIRNSREKVAYNDGTRKKKAVDEDDDAGLDFSDFIKYILIFAIIMVMVLFLGGQALQISKSQEK